jgi:hypothetical protein
MGQRSVQEFLHSLLVPTMCCGSSGISNDGNNVYNFADNDVDNDANDNDGSKMPATAKKHRRNSIPLLVPL